MTRTPHLLAALALGVATMAAPAALTAQQFDSNYEVTGVYDVTIDGAERQLFATTDTANDDPSITRHEVFGQVFYNITASADDGSGAPAYPILSLQLGPDRFPPKNLNNISLLQDGKMLMAEAGGVGKLMINDLRFGADGLLEFTFGGTLLAHEYSSDGDLVTVPDTPEVTVSGRFKGGYPLK